MLGMYCRIGDNGGDDMVVVLGYDVFSLYIIWYVVPLIRMYSAVVIY